METLKNSSQFERVRRAGRTWSTGLLVLNAAPNGQAETRCGFITGKKIGKAVKRNRARRLMREAVRRRLNTIKPGYDLVWIARAALPEAEFSSVDMAVADVLARGKLVAQPGETETASPQSRIIEVAGQHPDTDGDRAEGPDTHAGSGSS